MASAKSGLKSPLIANSERQRCEVWSRVMGYHRPISGWNIGKKQEFADRQYFKEPV
jgi:anaerobic ribonucleoside-triphosphate reductase